MAISGLFTEPIDNMDAFPPRSAYKPLKNQSSHCYGTNRHLPRKTDGKVLSYDDTGADRVNGLTRHGASQLDYPWQSSWDLPREVLSRGFDVVFQERPLSGSSATGGLRSPLSRGLLKMLRRLFARGIRPSTLAWSAGHAATHVVLTPIDTTSCTGSLVRDTRRKVISRGCHVCRGSAALHSDSLSLVHVPRGKRAVVVALVSVLMTLRRSEGRLSDVYRLVGPPSPTGRRTLGGLSAPTEVLRDSPSLSRRRRSDVASPLESGLELLPTARQVCPWCQVVGLASFASKGRVGRPAPGGTTRNPMA